MVFEPGQTVVVHGNRIAAIGTSSPPAGSILVDGTATAAPGGGGERAACA